MSETEPWVSAERMREIFEGVKNWGRWGPDDEAGALNFITGEHRAAAAASVTVGETIVAHVSLGGRA